MSKDKKIIYEPHPVSVERKTELNKQGYRIIDAIYKPADVPAVPAASTEGDADTDEDDKDEKDGLTKAELQQLLKDADIQFPANAKKADLLSILKANGLE